MPRLITRFSDTQKAGSHKHRKIALPRSSGATSLHSRTFSRHRMLSVLHLNFALRNRPGVTSNMQVRFLFPSAKRGNSLMERHQFSKTDKRTSLHSRNAAILASRNRMEVTSINMGSTPISPSIWASGLTARQQSHKLCKHTSLHSRGAPIFCIPT